MPDRGRVFVTPVCHAVERAEKNSSYEFLMILVYFWERRLCCDSSIKLRAQDRLGEGSGLPFCSRHFGEDSFLPTWPNRQSTLLRQPLSAKVVGPAHQPQKFSCADEIKPLRGREILLEPGGFSRSAGAKQKKRVIRHRQQTCKHGEHFYGKNARGLCSCLSAH